MDCNTIERLPFKFDGFEPRLHVSSGNSKTGLIPAFNLVPGDEYETTRDGFYIAPVLGTCAGVCGACKSDCYARRIYRMQRPGVVRAWCENTILVRSSLATFQKLMEAWVDLNEPEFFRVHSSGEFFSWRYFMAWTYIARRHPDTVFFAYTKRAEYLERYANEYGDLPSNFVVSVSQWNGAIENPTGAHEFIYDDGREDLAHVVHCPAVSKPRRPGLRGHKTGVTCDRCLRCAHAKPGARTAVYAH